MRMQQDMGRGRRRLPALVAAAGLTALVAAAGPGTVGVSGGGQVVYRTGQDIAPAFDGWEQQPDGSFRLSFGYFNRNWDEKPHVPVGPQNHVQPGGPDRGQPTLFQPRRNRFVFHVDVPADFGERELVWTLTVNGQTNQAYGSLLPGYITDAELQQFDIGDFGHNNAEMRANRAPTVRVEGSLRRTVAVGEPLALTALAADDGIPPVHAAPLRLVGRHGAWGLRVAWIVFRGPEQHVTFDPRQFKTWPDYRSDSPWTPGWEPPPLPPDGRFPVTVAFSRPGEYVIRAQAHDGGLKDVADVAVTVTAGGQAAAGPGPGGMRGTERLLAIEEIERLKASYFRCLDTKDWACIETLFTPDAEAVYHADRSGVLGAPDNPVRGNRAIAAFIRRGVQHLTTVHHGHMPEIEFTSPTTASGIWAMEDILQTPGGENTLQGWGHYHETYERFDNRWRIRTLRLTRLRVDRAE